MMTALRWTRRSWGLLVLLFGVTVALAADGRADQYLPTRSIDWVALLPPPPKAGSPEQRADLAAVIAAQRAARDDAVRRRLAIEDAEGECFRYADVLGPAFVADKLPTTSRFLEHALREGSVPSGIVKDHWQRPRPYVGNPEVERLADVSAGLTAAMRDYASYPSGHATRGTICAVLLGMLVPESRDRLFARAAQYRESRLIVGAHHPTDVEAGKVLGTAVVALMTGSNAFERDRAAAMQELRIALGLPAKPISGKEINPKTPLARD
ncbi:MAG: hypothetical protein RL469_1602 [Pseudomonadota bacterium]|jgi:acid phosphatase (class A)|nr:phosphatase PAP2 family protein [Gammaproteobacteria bacterium]